MAFVPIYILILVFTIIIDYIAGIAIENSIGKKRKLYLILSLISNIGILAFFKYYNFFAENINSALSLIHVTEILVPILGILLPIGLSFHTFQAMSYTIEVYRGEQKAERHFGIYALYVLFYPQLVAGPIERPQNLLPQFHSKQTFVYDNLLKGLRLMLWGMFKKVVIADRLAILVSSVFSSPQHYPAITLLIAAIFFSFQIYCDFSGYSDIAIGAARVMGFKLMTNFNKPYHAKNVSEFWKRWHISLSTWFKDYLYIPLGGKRVKIPRWYFNLFIVFLISGFWHGANWTFIVWGAIHGIYLVLAIVFDNHMPKKMTVFRNKHHFINNIYNIISTFILVMLAWIFFRANNISDALYIIHQLPYAIKEIASSIINQSVWLGRIDSLAISPWQIVYGFALIMLLELIHYLQGNLSIENYIDRKPIYLRWGIYYSMIFGIYFLGVFDKTQFIYFQF